MMLVVLSMLRGIDASTGYRSHDLGHVIYLHLDTGSFLKKLRLGYVQSKAKRNKCIELNGQALKFK